MPTLIIGIGIPGSGKTTILKKFAVEQGFEYISPDEIRKELFGREGDHWNSNPKRIDPFRTMGFFREAFRKIVREH